MAISTNQKPTIYRNLYENTGPDVTRSYYRNAMETTTLGTMRLW